MSEVTFTRDETEHLVDKIKRYFERELDAEIADFDAEFLLTFFGKEIGAHYYNKGLSDAHQLFSQTAEELSYRIAELEEPVS